MLGFIRENLSDGRGPSSCWMMHSLGPFPLAVTHSNNMLQPYHWKHWPWDRGPQPVLQGDTQMPLLLQCDNCPLHLEDEEVPIICPQCLVAVVFTDYLCDVGDRRHEPSKQLFSSHSSESLSSVPVSTSPFQGQGPQPSLGLCGLPLPSCFRSSTDTSFLCALVSCLLQGLQEVLISFLA